MINTLDKLLKLPDGLSTGLKDLENILQNLQGKKPQEIVSSLVDTIGLATFETKVAPASAEPVKDSQGFYATKVIEVIDETADTKTFRLAKPTGFHYQAGQFVNLRFEVDGKKHYRSYTLSSAPHQATLDITVKRVEGGLISNFMCDSLAPGQAIAVQGPAGKFHSANITGGDTLYFVSAGSGVTPLMAMLRQLDYDAATNPIHFLYSVRSPADIIFAQELAELAERLPHLTIQINFTRSAGQCQFENQAGRFEAAAFFQGLPPATLPAAKVYCCGPDQFMAAVKAAALESGIAQTNYFEESFGPAPKKKIKKAASGITSPAAAGPAQQSTAPPSAEAGPVSSPASPNSTDLTTGSSVQFAQSEVIVDDISGKTVLEVAEENGVEIDFSCLGGFCGYCKVKKLSGDVTMELTEALTPEELADDYILACNAKCNGRVVVDA